MKFLWRRTNKMHKIKATLDKIKPDYIYSKKKKNREFGDKATGTI